MKKLGVFLFSVFVLICAKTSVHAQPITYTVRSGDSMWKIAVRYQIGVSEIISANRQITNPNMIYPGQRLTVPNIDDVKALENEVIRLVNIERSKHGLAPLKANWELSRVARIKSQDMKNKGYFSHYSPTYGSPFDMMKKFGFSFYSAGENIAMGQRTPQEVMTAWMNSPGHRANILKADFKEIGVGLARDGSLYWTQMFMTR
ncbi:SafA/ExsA family spore coat assembly protein [Clostridium swellfunianum]|uniref:SafA/ExsA family spore coat assembly protein n=1 Tax=Clostridium swellfunianum TaxID=1367462 RepID=UPI00202EA83B|nr:SafA/ExsA family spore coat assembly protein [Clostridium swellfunianum]MCM0650484.1 SafA/ExsA family spore coat assembly protein [Clostridium swellfunianum]